LAGIPGESSDGKPERGMSRVKVFRGAFGEGKVVKGYNQDQFDYLVYEALYNEPMRASTVSRATAVVVFGNTANRR
jgi:hypothetical protein